jgi:hypothetical protein
MTKMHALRFLAVAVPLLLLSIPARADSREERERAARKACLTGDTAKGVDLLADLFLDTRDLTYIFNQGRCLEQNQQYRPAIGRFREYLVKGSSLSAEAKADAEKHIAVCESYLDKEGATPSPVPVPDLAAKPIPPPVAETPVVTAHPLAEPAATRPGAGLRVAGISIASLGGAALVTGVVLNLKFNSMTGELEQHNNYTRSADATRKDYRTWAWVSYGVAAACIPTGGVLYYLGWRKGKAAASALALVPLPVAGGAGTMLAGTF